MTEMHDVVEMLLNRMKDYPEDFVAVQSPMMYRETNKWERALRLVYEVADQHEKDALDIRTQEAKRAVYMGAALKTILSADEPEDEDKPYMTINAAGSLGIGTSNTPIWSNTSVSNGLTIGNANLTEDKINLISELEARVKAQEAQMQRQYAMMNANNTAGQLG